jgi:hypothetical protein
MSVDAYMMIECEWESEFYIDYTYETSILRTVYGYEQRSALISWPRRSVKYDITFMSEAESAYFNRVVQKHQGGVFGVPVWGEHGSLTAQATAGQGYVDLTDIDKTNYEVGGLAVIYNDWDDYEVVEIYSMTTTRLTLESTLTNTWPSGSSIYPMLHMTMEQNVPLDKVTSAFGGASVAFKEAWEDTITRKILSHNFPMYKGYYVFNKEPNWIEGMSISFSRPSEFLQKLGVQIRYTREPESEYTLEGQFLWDGVSECAEIRGFFDSSIGKWKQFWSPTWQRDVVITGAISSSDTTITIENIEYSSYWAENTIIGRYLFIMLPDGTELYRKVVGWPSSTQLTLGSAIGQDVAVSVVNRILVSFLLPVRFEIDTMEMGYPKPLVAETTLRMQSIHDETMSYTTTTTTTI